MTLKKPSPHVLTVWRIRLLLVSVLPSFLSAFFAPHINWIWWLFTSVWIFAFLCFYILYYPIKYRKLSYSFNERCLLIHCGVIYTRVKAVPFESIQYLSVASTPLQRLFGLCSLFVFAAGSTVYIPGLIFEEALALQSKLTPRDPNGGASIER